MLDKLCDQYAAKGQANLAAMLSLLLQDALRAVEYYRYVSCRSPVLLLHMHSNSRGFIADRASDDFVDALCVCFASIARAAVRCCACLRRQACTLHDLLGFSTYALALHAHSKLKYLYHV